MESVSFQQVLSALLPELWVALESMADYVLIHDRNMEIDQYTIAFRSLRGGPPEQPVPDDCSLLLPRGSGYGVWKGVVGFDVIWIQLSGTWYVSIGTNEVLDHPTRMAYVRTKAFLIRAGLDQPASAARARDAVRKIREIIATTLRTMGPQGQALAQDVEDPYDLGYGMVVIGGLDSWLNVLDNSRQCFLRTFCYTESMRPHALSSELAGYVSDANLSALRKCEHFALLPVGKSHQKNRRAIEGAAASTAASSPTQGAVPRSVNKYDLDFSELFRRIREVIAGFFRM